MAAVCSVCGEVIELGWMKKKPVIGKDGRFEGVMETDELYCDRHEHDASDLRCEFRTCDVCHNVMTQGYMNEDGVIRLCEECFSPWMDENCPGGWRMNEHEDASLWEGGYYDEMIDGKWEDTGIFWTDWR